MDRVATLIVNPAAGRAGVLRSQLPGLVDLLRGHGYQAALRYTTAEPHSGRELARQSPGSALILACGGDGTVHDVLQGVAHTGIPLGVLPLGTANVLARNLRLPLDPFAALTRLLTYTQRTIPLGELTTSEGTRLFAVVAGCGPDGALAHTLPKALKQRLGRGAYYAHAARLFATRRWPAFQVEYLLPGDPTWYRTQAVAVMCARVPDLGGLFTGLTRRAHWGQPNLHMQILKAPAQASLPAWFALSRMRLPNPLLLTVDATAVRCTPLTPQPIYTQADAEPAGTLPCKFRVVTDALSLLMPA